jgi:hypothetical protein
MYVILKKKRKSGNEQPTLTHIFFSKKKATALVTKIKPKQL